MSAERKIIDFNKSRFVQVAKEVIDNKDDGLKPVDISVYVAICRYANNDTKTAFPTITTLAKSARCSERVASRSIKTLSDAGYIDVQKRIDQRGLRTSNKYVILKV